MVVSIILIVGLFLLSKKWKFDFICKIMFYIGVTSEIVKLFFYIIANEDKLGGVLPKSDLPFHLCSIQIILLAILKFSKNEKLKRFLLGFMFPSCLFGGIAAILIPTSSSLNAWVITLQYNLYHISLIVFALHICTSKDVKLTIKDYFNCLKFLVLIMFFAIYINSVVYDGSSKINFMYVVSPPVDGLPFLTEKFGWFVYIMHYACLVLFCVTITYIKPIIITIIEKVSGKKKSKKSVEILDIDLEENSKTN
jgi:hypothetical protein